MAARRDRVRRDERLLLAWLKAYQADNPAFASSIWATAGMSVCTSEPAARAALPATRLRSRGSHDWATWMDLWRRLLDQEGVHCRQKPRATPQLSHKF